MNEKEIAARDELVLTKADLDIVAEGGEMTIEHEGTSLALVRSDKAPLSYLHRDAQKQSEPDFPEAEAKEQREFLMDCDASMEIDLEQAQRWAWAKAQERIAELESLIHGEDGYIASQKYLMDEQAKLEAENKRLRAVIFGGDMAYRLKGERLNEVLNENIRLRQELGR